LQEVLLDDRLARRADYLKEVMTDEIECLSRVRRYTWERLACNVGSCTHAQLQTWTLLAASTASGYAHKKFFSILDGHPWDLCRGDIQANLSKLALEDPSTDPTTRKIQQLLRLQYNRTLLADALVLLAEAPWSTQIVEQGHGSTAVLHKYHHEYGATALSCRTFLHRCRCLFRPSDQEVELAKLQARLLKLSAKPSSCLTGRHAFFRELVQNVSPSIGTSAAVGQEARTQCMQRHGALYAQLAPSAQAAFDSKAHSMNLQKDGNVEMDRAHVSAAIQMHVDREKDAAAMEGCLNHLRNCRFGAQDMDAMVSLLVADTRAASVLTAMRAAAISPPGQPSHSEQELLNAFRDSRVAEPGPPPPWCTFVAAARQRFHGCALCRAADNAETAYLFLYAMQSPCYGMFLTMTRRATRWPSPDLSAQGHSDLQAQFFLHQFVYQAGPYVTEAGLPFAIDGSDIAVLEGLRFVDGALVTDAPPTSLQAISRRYPRSTRQRSQTDRPTVPRHSIPALLDEFPWLQQYICPQTGKYTDDSNLYAPDPHSQAHADHPVDAIIDQAWANLQEAVAETATDVQVEPCDFYVAAHAGNWGVDFQYLASDAIRAHARSGLPTQWCKLYRLPCVSSFSIEKFTEDGASKLAAEVCNRYQHFYNIWRAHDAADHRYSQEQLSSYVEGAATTEIVNVGSTAAMVIKRAAEIRNLVPKNSLA
jgi:hypothetical protein